MCTCRCNNVVCFSFNIIINYRNMISKTQNSSDTSGLFERNSRLISRVLPRSEQIELTSFQLWHINTVLRENPAAKSFWANRIRGEIHITLSCNFVRLYNVTTRRNSERKSNPILTTVWVLQRSRGVTFIQFISDEHFFLVLWERVTDILGHICGSAMCGSVSISRVIFIVKYEMERKLFILSSYFHWKWNSVTLLLLNRLRSTCN